MENKVALGSTSSYFLTKLQKCDIINSRNVSLSNSKGLLEKIKN